MHPKTKQQISNSKTTEGGWIPPPLGGFGIPVVNILRSGLSETFVFQNVSNWTPYSYAKFQNFICKTNGKNVEKP